MFCGFWYTKYGNLANIWWNPSHFHEKLKNYGQKHGLFGLKPSKTQIWVTKAHYLHKSIKRVLPRLACGMFSNRTSETIWVCIVVTKNNASHKNLERFLLQISQLADALCPFCHQKLYQLQKNLGKSCTSYNCCTSYNFSPRNLEVTLLIYYHFP